MHAKPWSLLLHIVLDTILTKRNNFNKLTSQPEEEELSIFYKAPACQADNLDNLDGFCVLLVVKQLTKQLVTAISELSANVLYVPP